MEGIGALGGALFGGGEAVAGAAGLGEAASVAEGAGAATELGAAAAAGTEGAAAAGGADAILGTTPLGGISGVGAIDTGGLTAIHEPAVADFGGISGLGNPPAGEAAAGGAGGQFLSATDLADVTVAPEPGVNLTPDTLAGPQSGADVISGTFGSDTNIPAAAAGAESRIAQGGALGSVLGQEVSTTGGGVLGGMSASQLLRYGVPLAGLGYTLFRGEQGLPPQARQAQGIAGTEGHFGQEWLQLAERGQITPAQEAQITLFRNNAINALRQQYANANPGSDPSQNSGFLYGMQQIDLQASAMRQQYIDAMIRSGLQASSQATSALMSIAQLQAQEDRNFQAAIGDAMRAFGMAVGGGGMNIRFS